MKPTQPKSPERICDVYIDSRHGLCYAETIKDRRICFSCRLRDVLFLDNNFAQQVKKRLRK